MDIADLDWSLVASFLAVAEEGSLSAAARKLRQSQPTLGRHIRDLEDRLGVTLFHRQARGLALTQAGEGLLPPARAMREAMRQILLSSAGQESRIEGPVRVTASEVMSYFHLAPMLRDARLAEPGISVDLVPSDATSNLLFREADIAVRMFRPTQLDLVAQYLGEMEIGCFVAKRYVAQRGLPDGLAFEAHDFVGMDRSTLLIDGFAQAGVTVTRETFAVRCDDPLAQWALIRAGCGIGFGQRLVGRRDPDLVEIDLGRPLPTLPVWLTAHEAIRRTPRVRHVWTVLAEGLATLLRSQQELPA